MKKKLFCMLLCFLIAFTIVPPIQSRADAVEYELSVKQLSKKIPSLYYYVDPRWETPDMAGTGFLRVRICGLKKKDSIKKNSIKVGDKSIAKVIGISSFSHNSDYSSTLLINLYKRGKTKISFKIGSKKYSFNLITNQKIKPIKKITISGINKGKNINNYKDQDGNIFVKGSDVKNAVLTIKLKKGWSVDSIYVSSDKPENAEKLSDYSFGINAKRNNVLDGKTVITNLNTLTLGRLVKNYSYGFTIILVHKDGTTFDQYININPTGKRQ